MRSNKHCGRLFQWPHIVSAKAVLKALRIACGILCIFLGIPNPAKAALPQEGRIELRPRRELLERSSRELGDLSSSRQREVARRLRGALASERNPESKNSLKRLLADTPFYGSEASELRLPKEYAFGSYQGQAADRERPEYVQWVQESINRVMGMALKVDGILTPEVKEGIREFQRSNGLEADGIAGPKTERKLSEVTNTTAPGSWPFMHLRHPSLLHWLEESEVGEQVQPQVETRIVFLDVTNSKGRVSVKARTDVDFFLKGAGLPELANERNLSSIQDLAKTVDDPNTLVIHQGDDLPKEWSDFLGERGDYLRNSFRSPKKTLDEYIRATELLERRAEPGKTRIFSALPQAREEKALQEELNKMDLDPGEVKEWQRLQRDIDGVQSESSFEIEPGTKEAFLRELREGTSDSVILIAHSDDGVVYFPDGEKMTTLELSAVHRQTAPNRNLILSTCEAGKVNRPLQSLSEALLKGNVALNVIAHPNPISGLHVPHALREYLVHRKSINDVFIRRGYVPITENLEYNLDPKVTPLVSGDVLNKPLTTSVPS